MGGSKKSAKPPPKKESKYKIPTVFNCPKCGGKGTVMIQIKRAQGEGYVHCNGECSRMNAVDDVDLMGMDEGTRRPGQKRARERPPNYTCSVLRLEEPVDVFFKYYEDYRAQREREVGIQEGEGHDAIDEANIMALREAGGGFVSALTGQPLSAAGRRRAALDEDDDEEDEGLLLERDDNEYETGFEYAEGLN